MKQAILLATLVLGLAPAYHPSARSQEGPRELEAWPAPIEARVEQGAFLRGEAADTIQLAGLAGEVLSAQVAVRSPRTVHALRGVVGPLTGPGGAGLPAEASRVRYGGWVPVDETMQMTVDPLLEDPSVEVPANTARPVWLTITLPREAAPGIYHGELRLESESHDPAAFALAVEVLPAVLPAPVDWGFYLNIWQDPSAVARAHRVTVWSEEHWRLLERYAANYAAHGMKAITTHIIHDPWDSVRGLADDSMVEWRFPGEFAPGRAGEFAWDFTVFDRYVELMLAAGVREKIDLYAMVMGPGGATKADIRYRDTRSGEFRNLPLTVGDSAWREIWKACLPVLRSHLQEKGWFDRAILGFDEKPAEVMKTIFDFMVAEAPDFRISSSGGYPGDERKWADEIIFNYGVLVNEAEWKQYEPLAWQLRQDPKRYVGFYTCCMPHYPNTFLFSQLRESRLLPWLVFKYDLDGYIRWAVDIYPGGCLEHPPFHLALRGHVPGLARERWPAGQHALGAAAPGDPGLRGVPHRQPGRGPGGPDQRASGPGEEDGAGPARGHDGRWLPDAALDRPGAGAGQRGAARVAVHAA